MRNSIDGDGVKNLDIGKRFDSTQTLKGIICLSRKESILEGSLLHEFMHLWYWNVKLVPTNRKYHWGNFSSVNGQLGGFNEAELEHLGDDVYLDRSWISRNRRVYSPLELYLAGWIEASEVPPIMVAEDPEFVYESELESADLQDKTGYLIRFRTSKFNVLTIDDIVKKVGSRVPGIDQSQRHFRIATILLVNDQFPFDRTDIDYFESQLKLFSSKQAISGRKGRWGLIYPSFWEATGGRATVSTEMKSARKSIQQSESTTYPNDPIDDS